MSLTLSLVLAIFFSVFLTTSSSETDRYANPCTFARFEVDIAVDTGKSSDNGQRPKRAATSLKSRLWPNGVIPYEISDDYDWPEKGLIVRATRHWEKSTCLTFVPRTENDPDYIYFEKGTCVCCSFIGRQGGRQGMSLPNQCLRFGTIVHELGHAIGYWHEHSRPDRDDHIKVNLDNVKAEQEHNFDKKSSKLIDSRGERYDFNSIMHYGAYTFSKTDDASKPTIETIKKKFFKLIGQRKGLSVGDVRQTKKVYSCPKCGAILTAPRGNFFSPNYPKKYGHNLECAWKIVAPSGMEVRLAISDFRFGPRRKGNETAACFDYLEIWDRVGGTLLGKYCNRDEIPLIKSLGGLYLKMVSDSSKASRGFNASYETFCEMTMLPGTHGYLSSPNSPDSYLPNMKCTWNLTASPPNSSLIIMWDFWDIEMVKDCVYDYVEFTSSEHPEFYKRICGSVDLWRQRADASSITASDFDFKAPGNSVTVRFVSDKNVEKFGFRFRWFSDFNDCLEGNAGCQQMCTDTWDGFRCSCRLGYLLEEDGKSCKKDCGGILTASTGVIQSPNYPEKYPSNKLCEWRLVFPSWYIITLTFHEFDLEGRGASSCPFDNVTIEDANERRVYCGLRLGKEFLKFENRVNLTFSSDKSLSRRGFRITYKAQPDENQCLSNLSRCEQECIDAPNGYRCACYAGYSLREDGYSCEDVDECENASLCDQLCLNTPGNYSCSCKSGYVLGPDGKTCLDVDECAEGIDDCQFQCINVVGGYECSCPSKQFFLLPNGTNCQKCSGVLNDRTLPRNLIIPAGSKLTEKGIECLWKLKWRTGHHWRIHFEDLDCQRANIGLVITSHSNVLTNSCKEASEKKSVTYHYNKLVFNLTITSKLPSLRHIKITFESVCGGSFVITNKEQFLYSPTNTTGTGYGPNATCVWTLTNSKPRTQKIIVRIDMLSLRYSENCTADYLEISKENGSSERYCGNVANSYISVNSNSRLTLKFVSDANSTGGKGFKIGYKRIKEGNLLP